MGALKRLIRRFRAKPKPAAAQGTIEILRDGFTVSRPGRESYLLLWAEIETVVAFKLQLPLSDLINLGFHRRGEDDAYYRVHEDMTGFARLVRELNDHLPPADAMWMFRLVQAGHDAEEIVLWRRPVRARVPQRVR
ncbi:MAG TPA: hypothetical protein VER17_09120 [Tepidisphaeraceae bacterium]|nr:hypothetical protein [Tepidisphaeraceae bacterium]